MECEELSDLHIHTDMPITMRLNGELISCNDSLIKKNDINEFIDIFLTESQKIELEENKQIDLALNIKNYRFRVNFFYNNKGKALALRIINSAIPSFKELNIPYIVYENALQKNGLILITGPTGSGKSTSLASVIDKLNAETRKNIITIEDPIEFLYQNKQSVISQREIGRDAISFSNALRAALRQDPEIIMVGELRDPESISLALTAAETGHIVFGTLHTNSAPDTINRIIDAFPAGQQNQIRSQLSQCLRLVMTQQLIKVPGLTKRLGIFEIMICNNPVSNLIRENKVFQIQNVMETSMQSGMITMEKALAISGYAN
jgi:twitching motility protein PilT